MELVLGVALLALFSKKIIKTIKNIIVFGFIFCLSLILTFIYGIPYFICISICILARYGVKDWLLSIKNLGKVFIISKNKYKHGYIEKLVDILINCNYILFILLTYYFVINKLINPTLVISSTEAIVTSLIVVATIRVLRKILDKRVKNKSFSH